jgi:pimeloyl-ACP methyl ester carboxylesterase
LVPSASGELIESVHLHKAEPNVAPSKLLFLPGASGNPRFWSAVSVRLHSPASRTHLGWPGFGETPADPGVSNLQDLAGRVILELDQPTALIAQSMGGVVALLTALTAPETLTHIVLVATSGGLDVERLGASRWQPAFEAANPKVPQWFTSYRQDLSSSLHRIRIPTLLIWGDADPISPVAVGRRLASLLPHTRMHVINGADHDVAVSHAREVASVIDEFIGSGSA